MTKKQKKMVIRLAVSAVFFVIAMSLEKKVSWAWIPFVLSYLAAGYDIPLTRAIAQNVSIPVIASGGAGKMEHFKEALTDGMADAALAASLFHYKELEIGQVKEYLQKEGVAVRWQ